MCAVGLLAPLVGGHQVSNNRNVGRIIWCVMSWTYTIISKGGKFFPFEVLFNYLLAAAV